MAKANRTRAREVFRVVMTHGYVPDVDSDVDALVSVQRFPRCADALVRARLHMADSEMAGLCGATAEVWLGMDICIWSDERLEVVDAPGPSAPGQYLAILEDGAEIEYRYLGPVKRPRRSA